MEAGDHSGRDGMDGKEGNNTGGFYTGEKIVLAREDDLVYSCLDLNPKAVSQLQDETGLPSGSLLKSLYYLTAKDLAREVWQNYYIRTEKRWA